MIQISSAMFSLHVGFLQFGYILTENTYFLEYAGETVFTKSEEEVKVCSEIENI